MRSRVLMGPLPSTAAASSSSRGMESKYPTSSQTENGRVKVRYVTISPSLVVDRWIPVAFPMFTKIRNSGSRNRMPGNICVESTVTLNTCRPAKR